VYNRTRPTRQKSSDNPADYENPEQQRSPAARRPIAVLDLLAHRRRPWRFPAVKFTLPVRGLPVGNSGSSDNM
jgi:hypothetical protein